MSQAWAQALKCLVTQSESVVLTEEVPHLNFPHLPFPPQALAPPCPWYRQLNVANPAGPPCDCNHQQPERQLCFHVDGIAFSSCPTLIRGQTSAVHGRLPTILS